MDIVDLARMEAALRRTPGLAARLFTEGERAAGSEHIASAGSVAPADLLGSPSWTASARSVASLAGCFAAKEALAKVLGAPPGLSWTDAEVVRERSGRPFLRVRGTVAAAAARQGVTDWHLSISHDGGMCVAMVVGERAADRAGPADRAELARSAAR